jgi:hypothetical protein
MFHDMKYHDMFTICSFNSPDLDGHRAPKMKYCPRRDQTFTSQVKSVISVTLCRIFAQRSQQTAGV